MKEHGCQGGDSTTAVATWPTSSLLFSFQGFQGGWFTTRWNDQPTSPSIQIRTDPEVFPERNVFLFKRPEFSTDPEVMEGVLTIRRPL